MSYGLQTEFLASIVLDDVIRVATLFFFAEIIRQPLEKMPEAIFPASKVRHFELWHGLQTEFLATIVLDDVIRVATIFFWQKSSGHH